MVVQFNYRNLFGFSKRFIVYFFNVLQNVFVSILNDLDYIMYCLLLSITFEIFLTF